MLNGLTPAETIIVVVSIIISITIHEAMHGFAAYALGDDTAKEAGRLTLNPLKHIDLYTTILLPIVMVLVLHSPFLAAKPVPFNPNRVKFSEYGAALVGLAGPLSNFVLACLAAVVLRVFANNISESIGLDIYYFLFINVAIFVFNMIPIPPLDGSRLLYAFAPEPIQQIMENIESMGFIAILFIIILFYEFLGTLVLSIDQHLVSFLVG